MSNEVAKRDIHNIKEVVTFGFNVLKFGKSLFVGGKFQFVALGGVIGLYPSAVAAIDDIGDVVPEAMNFDEAEMGELAAHVISLGALPEDAAKIVAASLKAAIETKQSIESIINLVKVIKG